MEMLHNVLQSVCEQRVFWFHLYSLYSIYGKVIL